MKSVLLVINILVVLAVVKGLPTNSDKKINDEVEVVPPKKNQYGDQPIVDTGVVFTGPFSNPFGGLFDSIEGIMSRMREQMEHLLRRFPLRGGNSTDLPELPVGLPGFPQIGDLDLGKGNTTSVTKIIDGHKVVINETEYKKGDENGGAFFKVRIIDVKPDSSELTTERDAEEVTPTAPKDTESVENSFENEIPKSKELEVGKQSPEKLKAV